jgi:hypothetical protein
MAAPDSKLEEAALIRTRYNHAIEEAYRVYCDFEEIAAYAVLEVFRLSKMSFFSEKEEIERTNRIDEKGAILVNIKKNLHFILDRIHELAKDRDKYISDIYMSKKIIDLEEKLNNLTPWLQDLTYEMKGKAEAAKLYAKITTEVLSVKKY